MTGLLLDTSLTAEQRECAEVARRSGETLLTVINEILDLSKIEAGKVEIESLPFDLQQILEEISEMLASPGSMQEPRSDSGVSSGHAQLLYRLQRI